MPKQEITSPRAPERLEPRFHSLVVLVTGGTSGIGLATAIEFVRNGAATVIVCGRSLPKWDKAKREIDQQLGRRRGSRIEYIACDVRVEEQVRRLMERIFEQHKRLDVCVNNAGISTGGHIWDTRLAECVETKAEAGAGPILTGIPALEQCPCTGRTRTSCVCENPIWTNALGTLYCLKWELRFILERHPRHLPVAIINLSSTLATFGAALAPVYAASKAFVTSITKSVSADVATIRDRAPIRVNAVAPGSTDTPLLRSILPPHEPTDIVRDATASGVPLNRLASPYEVAAPILFLADHKASSFMTGAILAVDGGYTAAPVSRSQNPHAPVPYAIYTTTKPCLAKATRCRQSRRHRKDARVHGSRLRHKNASATSTVASNAKSSVSDD